jgi:hypothetical protein
LAAVLADAGTAMLTVMDLAQADQAAAPLHQVMAAALQIIDIETFQLTEHQDRDSQAVQEYDLINKVKIYMLPEAVVEQVVQVHVHQTIAMTEK